MIGFFRRRADMRAALVLIVLSLLFGGALVALVPPFRGADEPAHFLRAYGIARGDLVPSLADQQGRTGLRLPARMHAEFSFFHAAQERAQGDPQVPPFDWRATLAEYRAGEAARAAEAAADGGRTIFIPYGGSEGYSPIPYLPHIAAASVAQALDLSFLPTLYLMRAAGLVVFTLVTAFAMAAFPPLAWAFALIALLPSGLVGRALISADGASLAFTMAAVALSLRLALSQPVSIAARAVWTLLCLGTKPSHIVFVLLELSRPLRPMPKRLSALLAVTLPGLAFTALWLAAAGTDIATWRIAEGTDRAHFSVSFTLRHMWANPAEFPLAVVNSFSEAENFWRQLIGVLGWLDTPLLAPLYPAITLALIATWAQSLPAPRDTALRLALVHALIIAGYVLVVFFIFYVTWTPPGADRVYGVQGRYAAVVLPSMAVLVTALWRARGLPERWIAAAAMVGGVLSGIGAVEAVWRRDWSG